MSRLKHYANTLVSGYAALVVNALYTLASVPLALRYLSRAEYGLWATVSQVVMYLTFLDLGMNTSFGRILVDHKDRKDLCDYGSVLQTGLLVRAVQGMLILTIGAALSYNVGQILRIPAGLESEFRWLLIAQCAVQALGLVLRSFWNVLLVHQRWDIGNVIQMVSVVAGFGALWASFAQGSGTYSLVWAGVAVMIVETVCSLWFCWKLGFLPAQGLWGRPSWARFNELFAYGKDVYLFILGGLLTNCSQLVLVTRQLGLDAGAVWATCTRPFSLVSQVVYRFSDFSAFSFAEMMVRGERAILRRRFEAVVSVMVSSSVVLGLCFAVCNQPFVTIWTHGKIAWSPANDVLLAAWLLLTALLRAHGALAMQTKVFGWLRYVFLVEGVCFVALALPLLRWNGVAPMLLASMACSLVFSFPYVIRRTSRYFQVPAAEVCFRWCLPGLKLLVWFAPPALAIWWFSASLTPWPRLIVSGTSCLGIGGLLFLRIGLDTGVKRELRQRMPDRLQPLVLPLLGQ